MYRSMTIFPSVAGWPKLLLFFCIPAVNLCRVNCSLIAIAAPNIARGQRERTLGGWNIFQAPFFRFGEAAQTIDSGYAAC